MFSFVSSFSSSFLFALLFWPFLAAALTIPILVIQYRRYNRFVASRALLTYLFILYGLGLLSFTLYPMPDNPMLFCQNYVLSPQFMPFGFIQDIRSDGLQAVLQVTMNFLFFIPLGVFAKLLFGWRFRYALLLGFFASLLLETAQLTGAFGYYPCSYRLFDVDDLMLNTAGAATGYGAALLLPKNIIERANKTDVVRRAGLLRHSVGFIIDNIAVYGTVMIAVIVMYLLFDKSTAMNSAAYMFIALTVVVYGVMPYAWGGRSIGGYFTRLNHDDKPRKGWRRAAFYATRTLVAVLLLSSQDYGISFLTLIIILLVWKKRKKLPHQFI